MRSLGAHIALGALLGWPVFLLAGLLVSPLIAVEVGFLTGLVVSVVFMRTQVIGALVALLAPFGVLLPALVFADMGRSLGLDVPRFATWELAAFLLLYTGFLCSAFGVIPVDIYRLGYAPLPVAVMVLGLCAYAALTGNWFLALVAVLGQGCWVLKLGSSNWFDYVLHFLLWPLALIALIVRFF